MKLISKFFNELTLTELYNILKARSEVFVVEQNCVYNDIDGIDCECHHLFYEDNGKILAYLRIYEIEKGVVKIGRVFSTVRGKGYGGKILKQGVVKAKEIYNPKLIKIDAQSYASGYYAREGFKICSDEYTEDGIPHVHMELKL